MNGLVCNFCVWGECEVEIEFHGLFLIFRISLVALNLNAVFFKYLEPSLMKFMFIIE